MYYIAKPETCVTDPVECILFSPRVQDQEALQYSSTEDTDQALFP